MPRNPAEAKEDEEATAAANPASSKGGKGGRKVKLLEPTTQDASLPFDHSTTASLKIRRWLRQQSGTQSHGIQSTLEADVQQEKKNTDGSVGGCQQNIE